MDSVATALTEHSGYVTKRYGQLTEGVHIGAHALNRAIGHFKFLLDEDRWKQCGHDDINDFLASIDWSGFKLVADQRKDIVKALAKIEAASQRQIARTLGVDESTIRADVAAGNPAPADSELTVVEATSSADPPPDGETADRENTEETDETAAGNPAPASYSTIVIDPPWPIKFIQRKSRPAQPEPPYRVMQESEIAALRLPAADACHVWCWTTQKFLPMALWVLDVWGVKYVCTVTWCKPGGFQPVGLPQYASEFVLYGRIGSPRFLDTTNFKTWFSAPRGKHSEKPDAFYDLVRRVCEGPRADIFNRRPIEGFVGVGDESHL